MKRMLFFSIAAVCVLSSCTKQPLDNLTEDETRIYITNYDTTANFSSYKTFSIADSVAIVQNNQLQTREANSYDAQFISTLAGALTQRGYTLVNKGQSPDLGITVSHIVNSATGLVAYPSYGGYYDTYWDPYFWGYPGYSYSFPTYYGTYQINENALAVDMIDLKNSSQNNQLKDIWSGLVRGEGIFNTGNINTQVQVLLNQSPYLKNH